MTEPDRQTPPLPPARCLVCDARVRQVAEAGRVGLFESRDGRPHPHRCPDLAVAAWLIEYAYRRLLRRCHRDNVAPIPCDDAALCQFDTTQSLTETRDV
jgi:hypothetical protein